MNRQPDLPWAIAAAAYLLLLAGCGTDPLARIVEENAAAMGGRDRRDLLFAGCAG